MKLAILGLLIGLVAGYSWGYGDAHSGLPTVAERTLDRFGASKIRNAQRARERTYDNVAKP